MTNPLVDRVAVATAKQRLRAFDQEANQNVKVFGPEDFEADTPDFSLAATEAFRQFSIATAGAEAAGQTARDFGFQAEADPDFNFSQWITENPNERREFDELAQQDPTSPFFDVLLDIKSAGEAKERFRQLRVAKERRALLESASPLATIFGAAGGILVDTALAAGAIAATGGAAAPGLAAGAAALMRIRTASTLAARGAGAARVATEGAAIGFADAKLRQVVDPLVTNEDVAFATATGAIIGGALGGIAPKSIGRVDVRHAAGGPLSKAEAMVANKVALGKRKPPASLSAAAVDEIDLPDLSVMLPSKGAMGFGLVRKVLPKSLARQFFRNPKRVITDIGREGAIELAETGRQGKAVFFSKMKQLVRFSTVTEGDKQGIARAPSAQDFRGEFDVMRVAREVARNEEFKSAVKEMFPETLAPQVTGNLPVLNRKLVSIEDYSEVADNIAELPPDIPLTADRVIPGRLREKLTPQQQDTLVKHAQTSAKEDTDKIFKPMGRDELATGMLETEDDLVDFYRPHIADTEEIAANWRGYESLLLRAFEKEPDMDWVKNQDFLLKSEPTAEGGTKLVPAFTEDDTWATFAKREPELAEEAAAVWAQGIKDEATDRIEKIVQDRARDLRQARYAKRDQLIPKFQSDINKLRVQRTDLMDRLDELPYVAQNAEEIAELSKTLSRVEARLARREDHLAELRAASGELVSRDGFIHKTRRPLESLLEQEEALGKVVKKFSDPKTKRVLARLEKKTNAASRRLAAAEARKTVTETVRQIRESVMAGNSPYGFLDEDVITATNRTKRRNINWGELRFTDEWRRFHITNSDNLRNSYISSVGTQIALRKGLGLHGKVDPEAVKREFLAGFEEDLGKNLDDKTRKQINSARQEAGVMFDRMFTEFTHGDLLKIRKDIGQLGADTLTALSSLSAAMSLGTVIAANIGDMVLMLNGGGRMATGFRSLWRGTHMKKVLGELNLDQGEIAVLMRGQSAIDGTYLQHFSGVDDVGINIAGSKMRRVAQTTKTMAVIEGWTNFMTAWNRMIRGSFGLDFPRQMAKDFLSYDALTPRMKTFYARHGIDAKDAATIGELLRTKGRKVVDDVVVPDENAWIEAGHDHLLGKWKRALKSAGDEVLLDPQVGDLPFLSHFPGGRLVLQFQSFMFTAAERFIAPLMQDIITNPLQIRAYTTLLFALQLGALTDFLKSSINGEGEQWINRVQSDNGMRDLITSSVLRSTMMPGNFPVMAEVVLRNFARPMNNRFEDMVGFRPFKEESTRFREGQGAFAALGPVAGFVFGTLPSMGRKVIDGDIEGAATMLRHRTPVINTTIFRSLINAWEQ